MKSTRGFTLIELLVVIAIIGILSSVVLASLNTARQKGRDARRVADLKQIQLALELYYDANSSAYPAQLSSLSPNYIAAVPDDPGSGSYGYAVSGNSYTLGAILENTGQSGPLASDYDGNTSITINGGSNNCNDEAGTSAEEVYCIIN